MGLMLTSAPIMSNSPLRYNPRFPIQRMGQPRMKRFAGKVVLVTGAGNGIGYGIALAFAQEGAWVGLNDLDADRAAQAAQDINTRCAAELVSPLAFDGADIQAAQAAVRTLDERYGRVDVVVANAGITDFGDFLSYTPEQFDHVIGVNLRGTYFLAQAAARVMIARKLEGRILLMGSVVGFQAIANLSAYGVTKAGIRQMARALGLELGSYGITVNTIAPGATVTPRTQQEDPEYEKVWGALKPTRRAGQVEDVAAAALFLASPEARQINGQTLVVDGGWTGISPVPGSYDDR
jgi:glucose 1-dehydrogenase